MGWDYDIVELLLAAIAPTALCKEAQTKKVV